MLLRSSFVLRKSFARPIAVLFLAFVSLLGLGSTPSSQAQPPTARRVGRPFPPAQYIPPHNYDQRNIKLDLRFDWNQEQAIGTATITFAPTVRDLRRVEFDAAYLTISGVTLAG